MSNPGTVYLKMHPRKERINGLKKNRIVVEDGSHQKIIFQSNINSHRKSLNKTNNDGIAMDWLRYTFKELPNTESLNHERAKDI